MNKVILVGRLAQDPDVKYTQSGKAVCSFNIAVNRFVGGNNQKDSTDFIPIVAWEKLAEICGNNLTKGRRILVEGRLQIRTYDANDGQKRRIAEVIAQSVEFLESKQSGHAVNSAKETFGGEEVPYEEVPF